MLVPLLVTPLLSLGCRWGKNTAQLHVTPSPRISLQVGPNQLGPPVRQLYTWPPFRPLLREEYYY